MNQITIQAIEKEINNQHRKRLFYRDELALNPNNEWLVKKCGLYSQNIKDLEEDLLFIKMQTPNK